jgi:hypothetical protein
MLEVRRHQPLPIPRNIKRKVRTDKMEIRQYPRRPRFQVQHLNLLIPIRPDDLKSNLLPVRPPYGPSTVFRQPSQARPIRMHKEDPAGKPPVGAEADPFSIWRPPSNGAGRINQATRLAASVRRCNVKLRNLVFRSRECHRSAVGRDIGVSITAVARRGRRPRRSTLAGHAPNT